MHSVMFQGNSALRVADELSGSFVLSPFVLAELGYMLVIGMGSRRSSRSEQLAEYEERESRIDPAREIKAPARWPGKSASPVGMSKSAGGCWVASCRDALGFPSGRGRTMFLR